MQIAAGEARMGPGKLVEELRDLIDKSRVRVPSPEPSPYLWLDHRTIYSAVRAFGQSAWNKTQRLKAAGEQRIFVKFPDDSRIT
jgi:hypothetical protein